METPNTPIETPEEHSSRRLDLLLDVPLEITVELGRSRMSIQDLLSLGPGSVVELDKIAGEPLDILVNDRLLARGEAVVCERQVWYPHHGYREPLGTYRASSVTTKEPYPCSSR